MAKVSTVKVSTLLNWQDNPRSIKKNRFEELKVRIKKHGFNDVLKVAADGVTVIGGNMRLRALKELGVSEVQVLNTGAKSDKEKFEIALDDNEEFGQYEREELIELAYNLSIPTLELNNYLVNLSEPVKLGDLVLEETTDTTEDEPPEVSNEPAVSKLGEVYQLGRHKVMCGDSTNKANVGLLMNGHKADMVFTDPPYNADYSGLGQNELGKIKNDNMSNEDFDKFIDKFLPNLNANTKDGGAYYICCNWKDSYPRFYFACQRNGINVSANIVWNKGSAGMGWQDYRYQYEFIIYGFTEGHQWYGGRAETDIWDFNRDNRQSYDHPTQKPVILSSRAIKNSSKKGDVVLDLFGGSGSTLIACEQLDRTCYMMELDPKYCDVIRKRYAKLKDPEGWEEKWQQMTPKVQ